MLKKCSLFKSAALVAGLLASTQAFSALIDLSSWEVDGSGSWTLTNNNNTAFQSINGSPTVFFESGSSALDKALSGQITVDTTGDDDFVGFVLGYQDGEFSGPGADFWLVDWKQGAQDGQTPGLALSHVTNGQNSHTTSNNYWLHNNGVREVARATNLGTTGWTDFRTYSFDLVFTSNLIQIVVDDVLELSVTAAQAGVAEFTDGAFGFYNYSQERVSYSGILEQDAVDVIKPVPEPETFALFGLGLLAFAARRVKK